MCKNCNKEVKGMFPSDVDLELQKKQDKTNMQCIETGKDMQDLAAEKLTELFEVLKLDLEDPNLADTPKRISKMFINETLSGLYTDPPKITTFPNTGDDKYDGMVVVKDMAVHSLCSHHWQNFDGLCTIAYIPGKRVVGLSKFSRVVDYFARRPQLQERLTKQIFNHLSEILETENIVVTMTCTHNCMAVRGVKEHEAETITTLMGGLFSRSDATRNEFLSYTK